MFCDEKAFSDRIHKISGQIEAIERMYADKRTAAEIMQQLVAVRSSLSSLARVIVEAEVKGCLPAAEGSPEKLRPVSQLVDTLFKVT